MDTALILDSKHENPKQFLQRLIRLVFYISENLTLIMTILEIQNSTDYTSTILVVVGLIIAGITLWYTRKGSKTAEIEIERLRKETFPVIDISVNSSSTALIVKILQNSVVKLESVYFENNNNSYISEYWANYPKDVELPVGSSFRIGITNKAAFRGPTDKIIILFLDTQNNIYQQTFVYEISILSLIHESAKFLKKISEPSRFESFVSNWKVKNQKYK